MQHFQTPDAQSMIHNYAGGSPNPLTAAEGLRRADAGQMAQACAGRQDMGGFGRLRDLSRNSPEFEAKYGR